MVHSNLSFIYLMSISLDVLCLSFPAYSFPLISSNQNSPIQITSQIATDPQWVTWVKIDLENNFEEKVENEKLCPNLLRRGFCSSKSCKKVCQKFSRQKKYYIFLLESQHCKAGKFLQRKIRDKTRPAKTEI